MESSLPNRYINKIRSNYKKPDYINIIYIKDGKMYKMITNIKSDAFDPFLYMKNNLEVNLPSINFGILSIQSDPFSSDEKGLNSRRDQGSLDNDPIRSFSPPEAEKRTESQGQDGIKLLKQVNTFINFMKMGQSLESLIKPENKNEIINIKDKKINKKE